ncbi:DUF551 domain-containing protein [Enterobacter roggenkampii]|uniref:DUF551 domain-containing protein n=1 Tax=Enterobacter roggenkampii TaxID=1812935 RepID=UPI003BE6A786
MSTITREFTKEQLQQIIETDHVQCGEASSLARIALASLEAEPVAWAHRLINKRNGVVHPWVYGSAEACPSEGDIFNIEVMPLYTAPPAPVSVPAAMEMDDDFDSSFEHGKAVGWNAYRAAMLQSFGNSEQLNSPVIPDGWVACSEQMPEDEQEVIVQNKMGYRYVSYFDEHSGLFFDMRGGNQMNCIEHIFVTHWMPLPSAPQQEA